MNREFPLCVRARPSLRLAALACALAVAPLWAGCIEEEAVVGPAAPAACASEFVTLQWRDVGAVEEVREAFESSGYRWVDTPLREDLPDQGVARLEPPNELVRGVVSTKPGVSGEDLVLSFEETTVTEESAADVVAAVATDAQRILERAFPSATLVERIEGAHTGACGAAAAIPPGGA